MEDSLASPAQLQDVLGSGGFELNSLSIDSMLDMPAGGMHSMLDMPSYDDISPGAYTAVRSDSTAHTVPRTQELLLHTQAPAVTSAPAGSGSGLT